MCGRDGPPGSLREVQELQTCLTSSTLSVTLWWHVSPLVSWRLPLPSRELDGVPEVPEIDPHADQARTQAEIWDCGIRKENSQTRTGLDNNAHTTDHFTSTRRSSLIEHLPKTTAQLSPHETQQKPVQKAQRGVEEVIQSFPGKDQRPDLWKKDRSLKLIASRDLEFEQLLIRKCVCFSSEFKISRCASTDCMPT